MLKPRTRYLRARWKCIIFFVSNLNNSVRKVHGLIREKHDILGYVTLSFLVVSEKIYCSCIKDWWWISSVGSDPLYFSNFTVLIQYYLISFSSACGQYYKKCEKCVKNPDVSIPGNGFSTEHRRHWNPDMTGHSGPNFYSLYRGFVISGWGTEIHWCKEIGTFKFDCYIGVL